MTVQKRTQTTKEFIQGEMFELPPELASELEAMNQNIDQHRQQEVWSEDEGRPEETEAQMPETDELADYRIEVLGKAAHIVTQDRNVEYGPPEDSFATIAALWNAYLGGEHLLTTDVAAMLALLKIARLASNPISEDSWIDLAGYAACGASAAKVLSHDADTAQ